MKLKKKTTSNLKDLFGAVVKQVKVN